MHQEFQGPYLTNDGNVCSLKTLLQKEFVLIYFWRSDSPKMVEFSELLMKWYLELRELPNSKHIVEIVTAPVVASEAAHKEFTDETPWISLPLHDPRIEEFREKYELEWEESDSHLPRILVLSPQPRTLLFVSDEGVAAIESSLAQGVMDLPIEKWRKLRNRQLERMGLFI